MYTNSLCDPKFGGEVIAKAEDGGHCGSIRRGAARASLCGPTEQRQGSERPQGLCHQGRASTPAARRPQAWLEHLHQEPCLQPVPRTPNGHHNGDDVLMGSVWHVMHHEPVKAVKADLVAKVPEYWSSHARDELQP